ncbi:DNA invertase Pin-like site-specific DNA recombinase [Azospirillum brasilense]|uniref:DNA invertase Pin-like site-specific DNA recombinase n=1 Tax=Azospirillum brasilense TaxID=192 RepID=A0A560CIQ7_AZOBR|nr:recombinase family protein [Azospirillum brasilense]TWA84744.1 DNA invertase Pin-like site-specific DNA recombinase [Azospirillum brasilense]
MALIGYARVSTDEQTTDPQLDALKAAGCSTIHREHGSGGDRSRPELKRAIARCRAGDVLVVVRIDRLARSLAHLLEIIEALDAQGAGFRSLGDPIDTTSPQGRFTLQILGAVAEFERALIRERTKAGLKAARERGRIGGNPGLRFRSAAAVRAVNDAREARRDADVLRVADDILPHVRAMRPGYSWATVARSLARNGSRRPDGGPWTGPALARAVRRLARDGFVDDRVLERTPRRRDSDDLVTLVASAVKTLDNPTLTNIARHLEELHCRTPRGETRWSVSSVQNLLGQAVAQGLLEDRPLPAPEAPRRRGRPPKSLKGLQSTS